MLETRSGGGDRSGDITNRARALEELLDNADSRVVEASRTVMARAQEMAENELKRAQQFDADREQTFE